MNVYTARFKRSLQALVAIVALFVSKAIAESETKNPISIGDLLALHDVAVPISGDTEESALSVSPDNSKIAFQLRRATLQSNSYESNWYVTDLAGERKPQNVGDAGEYKFHIYPGGLNGGQLVATSTAKWSPDGKWIAYLAKHDGQIQLWRSRTDGTIQEQITNGVSDVVEFEWSKDGRGFLLKTRIETREETQQRRRRLARSGYLIDEEYFPIIDRAPLFAETGAGELKYLNLSEEKIRKLSQSEEGEIANFLQRSNGRRYFEKFSIPTDVRRHDVGDRWVSWTEQESKSEEFAFRPSILKARSIGTQTETIICRNPLCQGDIRSIWGQSDEEIYFERREGADASEQAIYAWSPAADELREVYRTTSSIEHCEQAKAKLICLYSAANQPAKIISLDLLEGTIRSVFDPNPDIQTRTHAQIERLEWSNEFDHEAFAYLVKPIGFQQGNRYPLVVVPHQARGFLRGGSGDEVPIYPLAAEGFMVLVFDKPNAVIDDVGPLDRHENDFQDYRSALSSLEIIISELDNRGLVDTNHMGISGLSDGVAFMYFALMRSTYDLQAAVACTSTWEPIGYYLTSTARRKVDMDQIAGIRMLESGNLDGDFFYGISPSQNPEKINTPILVNMPDTEILAAMQTIVTLQELEKPIEAFVYSNEWHFKWQPAHRNAIYRRNLQWFLFWLKGEEVADPVDPDQYVRWRQLREQHEANLAELETNE